MSVTELLALSAIGIVVAFVWISLMRSSMRGGCRSGSCRSMTPHENDKKDD